MKPIHFTLLFLLFTISFTATAQTNDPIPEHETFTIQSEQVGELRVINVWVPPTYKTTTDSFAVLYMADGGIKEDFPHIANTLAELINEQNIKPIILVGIENTQRRKDLTGFTEVAKDKKIAPVVGGSEKFRAFINNELFPEINNRYRTTDEKCIIGESLAGLFVMETFFTSPEMFDNYIAFDPSLWWNNHFLNRTAKEQLAKFPSNEKRLWFAGSNTKDISKYTRELADILKAGGPVSLNWKYSDEPNEEHSTIFRATKEKAIIWALNKND